MNWPSHARPETCTRGISIAHVVQADHREVIQVPCLPRVQCQLPLKQVSRFNEYTQKASKGQVIESGGAEGVA